MNRFFFLLATLILFGLSFVSSTTQAAEDENQCTATGTITATSIAISATDPTFTGDMESDKVTAYLGPNAPINSNMEGVARSYDPESHIWTFTFPTPEWYDPEQALDYSVAKDRSYCSLTPVTGSDGDDGGIGQLDPILDPIEEVECTTASRYAECMADPDAYDENICFSEHAQDEFVEHNGPNGEDTTVSHAEEYNSLECQTQRGMRDCKKNPPGPGAVYLRAFGTDPENSCVTFIGFTKTIINYAMLIAALIAGAMLLKGGFKYVVSRGSATALIEARDEILHASIGIAMLAIAYVAILFLQGSLGFLGVDLVGPFAAVFGG